MKTVLHTAIALAIAGLAGSAQAERPTLTVAEQLEVAAPADKAWEIIQHFENLNWHPAVASTELVSGKADKPGAVRLITLKDGAKIKEELVGLNPKAHSITYKFLESPLPVTDYVSTLEVVSAKNGSLLKWHSTFKRKDEKPAAGADDASGKKIVSGIYTSGMDALKKQLEGAK